MAATLLLASTSPYRRRLLERLGMPFAIESPHVNEEPIAGETAPARARRLALAKAAAVSARHPRSLVLGSDQVAERGGILLDKPGYAEKCSDQLRASSGREVRFHTAAALVRAEPTVLLEHLDLTTVGFRRLSEAEIARYVELDAPYDCAGGFRCEGLGIALFQSVETSDPTALIGLPLIWVASALRASGFDPLTDPRGRSPAATM